MDHLKLRASTRSGSTSPIWNSCRVSWNRKRRLALRFIISLLAALVACGALLRSEVRPPQLDAPAAAPAQGHVAQLCESIKEIEVLPFKGEPVPDPAYNALASAGEDAIPCLIRK